MLPPTRAHDLRTLILSFHPVVVMETVEEQRVRSLLRSVSYELRLGFFEWTVTRGLSRVSSGTTFPGTAEPAHLLRHLEAFDEEAVFWLKDLTRHLEDPKLARHFREVAHRFGRSRSTLVLTGEGIELPPALDDVAARYELELPGHEELRDVLRHVVESLRARYPVRVDMLPAEIEELLRALAGMTLNQARQTLAYCLLEDGRLSPEDLARVVDRKAQLIREGGLLEYYPVADNHARLGGFDGLKAWLDRARVGFTPRARELNLTPPRGILIVGVQGCGKSLAAKFIAREWRLPLLKLDAGRLFDKYVGESEKNFRKALTLAESMAPVVLWIDEIEKGMAPTGSGESDGGLSRRLFGSFLTWMQEKRAEVFVTATANDLSQLPPELLRKGRFDEIFFADLPDAAEREAIFGIHLRRRKQDPDGFDRLRLVEASQGYSGAEIEQAVIAALYRALHAGRSLDTGLLLTELGHTVPLSVSRREDVQSLRHHARGRFVSVR